MSGAGIETRVWCSLVFEPTLTIDVDGIVVALEHARNTRPTKFWGSGLRAWPDRPREGSARPLADIQTLRLWTRGLPFQQLPWKG